MLKGFRVWVPIVLCVIGVVIVVAGNFSEGALGLGCALIASASSIGLLNWFYQFGVKGDLERDDEQAARDFYAEHGRWPTRADQIKPTH